MTDTEKPALSDMEKFELAEELEAAKAEILTRARGSFPGAELSLLYWQLSDAITKRDRLPNEFNSYSKTHLTSLEALIAEIEAAKAVLLRTAQLECPANPLRCIRFCLDNTRTQHEAAPDAVDADDRVELAALESLVSDLEREEKQP